MEGNMKNYQRGEFKVNDKAQIFNIGEYGPFKYVGILFCPQDEKYSVQVFGDYNEPLSEGLDGLNKIFDFKFSNERMKEIIKYAENEGILGISCDFDKGGKFQVCVVNEDETVKRFNTLEDAFSSLTLSPNAKEIESGEKTKTF